MVSRKKIFFSDLSFSILNDKTGSSDKTLIISKVNFLYGVRSESYKSPRMALLNANCKSWNKHLARILRRGKNTRKKNKVFRPVNPTSINQKRKIYIENSFSITNLPYLYYFPFVYTTNLCDKLLCMGWWRKKWKK